MILNKRSCGIGVKLVAAMIVAACCHRGVAAEHWLVLKSPKVTVGVHRDLTLEVYRGTENPVWSSATSSRPAIDRSG